MNTKKIHAFVHFQLIISAALYEKIVLEEWGTVGFLCWY